MATKLARIRLSNNTSGENITDVVDFADGVNGQVNVSKNGKKFVVLEFEDDSNPFAIQRAQRNYWLNQNADGQDTKWPGYSPKVLAEKALNKTVQGEFRTFRIPEEEIDLNGRTVKVNKTTTFFMSNEIFDDKGLMAQSACRLTGKTILDNEKDENGQYKVLAEKSNPGQASEMPAPETAGTATA